MKSTLIKICGLTTPEDAAFAIALGADYIGVIFADSPRRVSVDRAAAIRDAIPSAHLVGVFRNAPLPFVAQTARGADLDILQFHGHESPGYCDDALALTGRPVIKVFNSGRVPEVARLATYTTTSYFLFDTTKDGSMSDDARYAQVAGVRRLGFRVFLAGGLTPDNVRDAVSVTRPFAVDVCRGVERAPGVKDRAAMERFVAGVRG